MEVKCIFFCREGESGSWNRSVETHSNSTSQYIDGLNPYTVYLFRVAAENALGYSKPGKESYPTLTHRERESYFLFYCRTKIRLQHRCFPSFPDITIKMGNFQKLWEIKRGHLSPFRAPIIVATKWAIKAKLWDYHCATFMATKKFGHSISKWGSLSFPYLLYNVSFLQRKVSKNVRKILVGSSIL